MGKYTTKNGPQLIEVNARMGGGPVRDLNLAVWGVDLVEEQLMASVGLPANPPCAEKLVSVGDEVMGVDDGMPTWIADIVVEKPTAEVAIKYACELNDKFEQPIY